MALVGDLTVNHLARSHREALHSGDRRELRKKFFVGRNETAQRSHTLNQQSRAHSGIRANIWRSVLTPAARLPGQVRRIPPYGTFGATARTRIRLCEERSDEAICFHDYSLAK